jgi:MFS transporter, DHA2 family, multidrug resistance protein
MEVLDITIANVALRYIAGSMGVSEDEASWVVTTYLVANAVALTASSFLARLSWSLLLDLRSLCAVPSASLHVPWQLRS